uniref:Uncharacterized protein n=1 Tax=Sinocyclocheilus anshuiensis TaxID=1608454 RepID=A0A671KSK9_9TELE
VTRSPLRNCKRNAHSCATSPKRAWHHLRRPSAPSAGQHCRLYSKDADRDTKDTEHPGITVVGTPDPIAWIRNKIILFLIELCFGLKFSVEIDSGVKQAAVHASTMLSKGKFDELRSVMSKEVSRKFLYITMRLWYLSSADVPEDPESARIFRMDLTEDDGPQKKTITAVYEVLKYSKLKKKQ